MKTLRIFISSPGDVADERDKAKQVIAMLAVMPLWPIWRHSSAAVLTCLLSWSSGPVAMASIDSPGANERG
jgi:hypothetical protein